MITNNNDVKTMHKPTVSQNPIFFSKNGKHKNIGNVGRTKKNV